MRAVSFPRPIRKAGGFLPSPRPSPHHASGRSILGPHLQHFPAAALQKNGRKQLIAVAGDTHGLIENSLAEIRETAKTLEADIVAVIQVGDLGIYQDPQGRSSFPNKAKYFRPSSFAEIRDQNEFPLVFVAGNHEDFPLLALPEGAEEKNNFQGLYQLGKRFFYLPNGYSTRFQFANCREKPSLSLTGLGGIFHAATFPRPPGKGQGRELGYFRELELTAAEISGEGCDILLFHEGPHSADRLWDLTLNLKPKVLLHGHEHRSFGYRIGQTPVIGVNEFGYDGHLHFLEVDPQTAVLKQESIRYFKNPKTLDEWLGPSLSTELNVPPEAERFLACTYRQGDALPCRYEWFDAMGKIVKSSEVLMASSGQVVEARRFKPYRGSGLTRRATVGLIFEIAKAQFKKGGSTKTIVRRRFNGDGFVVT